MRSFQRIRQTGVTYQISEMKRRRQAVNVTVYKHGGRLPSTERRPRDVINHLSVCVVLHTVLALVHSCQVNAKHLC